MLAKNKSGWKSIKYIDIKEDDIGYVDECDVKIVQMVCKR